jgi:hypothetical protein
MYLAEACLFGLYHFEWAVKVLFLTGVAMSCTTIAGLEATLLFYSEGFLLMLVLTAIAPLWITELYASFTLNEMCLLGLFYALTALIFIHYMKVYFDFRSIWPATRLRFAAELFGLIVLVSTFLGTWSTALVFFFHISTYGISRSTVAGQF